MQHSLRAMRLYFPIKTLVSGASLVSRLGKIIASIEIELATQILWSTESPKLEQWTDNRDVK